jgi:predicted RNase H-like HicB family nuclease
MSRNIAELARELANRPYPYQVFRDDEGVGEARYLAKNPDLDGLMAQGATQSEAVANLAKARFDLMQFLLKRNWPIPEPSTIMGSHSHIIVTGISNVKVTAKEPEQTMDDILDSVVVAKVIEKDSRELLYEASLETLIVSRSDDYSEMRIHSSSLGDISDYNDERHP